MSRVRTLRVLQIVLVLSVLAVNLVLSHPTPAHAESTNQQFLTVTSDPAQTFCLTNFHRIAGSATLIYPQPSVLKLTLRVNGAVITSGISNNPFNPNPMSGSWNLAYFVNPPISPANYTMEWEWIISVGGQPVWRNTAGFTCVNGVVTNLHTVNQDLTLGEDLLFKDGRLNSLATEADQTVAIYCKNGTVELLGWRNQKSFLAFRVSREELAQFPEKPETNTLIKEAHGISLYRLTTGQLQVNSPPLEAGKPDYSFIFKSC